MKKIFLVIAIIFIYDVPYPNAMITDYRDNYVGSYFCNRGCQRLKSDHSGLISFNDTITIDVTKEVDSLLNISIGKSKFKVKVVNGIMYPCSPENNLMGKFFSTDSISFGLIVSHVGNTCGFKGKKMSN